MSDPRHCDVGAARASTNTGNGLVAEVEEQRNSYRSSPRLSGAQQEQVKPATFGTLIS